MRRRSGLFAVACAAKNRAGEHARTGLSNYCYRHGDDYKRLLQQSRRTQPFDLNAFVAFGVEGFAAELRGINNFIKTKLNRVVYRATLVRAFNQRAGKRRPVLTEGPHATADPRRVRALGHPAPAAPKGLWSDPLVD